jgi:transposase
MRAKPCGASVYGIDIGKNRFHVVVTDASGRVLQRVTLTRQTIFHFFANSSVALIGMEACPGSQWLARKLAVMGHTVKMIPAQFVKPYVKSNKNDLIDAAAIAEAVTRPSMRFVTPKSTEQVEIQTLHRIRNRVVSSKIQLINQVRAFCLEFGIAIRQGVGMFKADLPAALANLSNDLTPRMRVLLEGMWDEFGKLERRLAELNEEIEDLAARSEIAHRLSSIPGIGPLCATAIIAAVGDGKQFGKARDMAAWLGLVPRQHSTGGKTTLLGISKRGNAYIRKLLIHGARSCVLHLNRQRDRLAAWIAKLSTRMHTNKVAVALANKLARVAWVVLTRPGSLYRGERNLKIV